MADAARSGPPAGWAPATPHDELADEVAQEIRELARLGFDVHAVRATPDVDDPETRQRVSAAIQDLARRDDWKAHLFRAEVHPTGAAWLGLAKRAIALGPLYQAGRIRSLGDGFDIRAYDEDLFQGRTARQVLSRELGAARAGRVLATYQRFLDPGNLLADAPDEYGLTSGDYLTHVVDSHGVRTRARAALARVDEHIVAHSERFRGRPLATASLACGAAWPVLQLARTLRRGGLDLSVVNLVDWDVMALASAHALAETNDLTDIVEIHRRKLFKESLTSYIRPHSVDVVDILGLFEYIPTALRAGPASYAAAADFLGSVRDIVRPGGLIIVGNMLRKRPQQAFFDAVWPPLQQRTITEVVGIVEAAGYDTGLMSIDVPADEGIYAVYTIRIPDEEAPRYRRSIARRGARAITLRRLAGR